MNKRPFKVIPNCNANVELEGGHTIICEYDE